MLWLSWIKIMNIRNVICVSSMSIFQHVAMVYKADLSEFIMGQFKRIIFG